jgi:hypothetical protein
VTVPAAGVVYTYDTASAAWVAPGRDPLLAGPAGWTTPPAVVAGSLPIGTASYAVPDEGQVLFVSPSGSNSAAGTLAAPKQTIGGAHSAASTGAVIVVRAGIYHESLSITKQVTIQAYPGEAVWLDGSKVYASWTGSGPWTASLGVDWSPIDSSRYAYTDATAVLPEQVWVNGVMLKQLADGATPAAGQFSVDRTANTITIGTSPVGAEVRVTELRSAVVCSARTELYGLGIRRYSPSAMEGGTTSAMLYYGGTSQGSILENVVLQESGVTAMATARQIVMRNITVQDCNHTGIQITTADGLIGERGVVRRMNRGAWQGEPITAAIKITYSDDVLLRNWILADVPKAVGLWLDSHVRRYALVNIDVDGTSGVAGVADMRAGIEPEAAEGGYFNGVQYYGHIVNCRVRNTQYSYKSLVGGWHKYINCKASAYSTVGFYLQQDARRNTTDTQHGTIQESPWLTKDISLINNDIGQGGLQVIAYHDPVAGWEGPVILGWDCFQRIAGNWFRPTPPGSMVQLGKADGYRNSYNTLAALAASPSTVGIKGDKLGVNHQGNTAPADSIADPLSAEVAALLGVPAGLQRVGPILPAPVPSF